jgi:8-oxo-dGTP pyrophosphatase MutT (NUDIX family)
MERRDVLSTGLSLTRAEIIARVTASRPVPDLRGDHMLDKLDPPEPPLKAAAVLVPIVEHASGLTVLLTKRTDHLHAHAGQVSFPGGRAEANDVDVVDTALREAHEEVGLPRDRVQVLGPLNTYSTVSSYVVTPIVGLVQPPFHLNLDAFEVAEAFEVPLSFVVDSKNHRRTTREFENRTRVFFVLPFQGRNIWGATAGMLVNLAEVLSS